MITIGLLIMLSSSASIQEVGEFRAKNVAASYLVERLNPKPEALGSRPARRQEDMGLIPAGLAVSVDLASNTLRLSGKAEDISHAKRYMQFFDVAPKRVELQLGGELPLLNYTYSNPVSVTNNGKWTLEEPSRGLFVSIIPRLNDDGYATIFIEHRFGETSVKATTRVKIGETVHLDQKGQPGTTSMIFNGLPGAAPPFRLRLTFKGVVAPPTPN